MATLSSDVASPAYDALAPFYDDFTAHHDYEQWVAALERLARENGLRGERVLDVACGTGKSCAPFVARGYAVTGCDGSQAMLDRARVRLPTSVRLVRRDLRALGRLGRFDLVCCIDDGLNYLLHEAELVRALRGMAAQLRPGGIVLFDVNTLATYRGFFASETTVRTPSHDLRWRGLATAAFAPGAIAEAQLDLVGRAGGSVRTVHRQRHHAPAVVERALAAAGLELVARRGQDLSGAIERELDELRHTKALYIARS
ncbi:MAG TPA: methyltransferase domain-containing protein [Solirubrobacteraceae bacterium]|nr:methyltransferase domain-containing protein [Solirubrobacteraceae bacterium]